MYVQPKSSRKINSGAKLLVIDCDGTITIETSWWVEDILSKSQDFIPRCFHNVVNAIALERKPNVETINWMRKMSDNPDCQILILTSRLFYLVSATQQWMEDNNVPYDTLVCRRKNEEPIAFKLDFFEANRSYIHTIVDNDWRVLREARTILSGEVKLLHPRDIHFTS